MRTEDAIKEFGSVRALAQALGVSVQAVYAWGENVPRLRAYEIREKLDERAAQQQLNESPTPYAGPERRREGGSEPGQIKLKERRTNGVHDHMEGA